MYENNNQFNGSVGNRGGGGGGGGGAAVIINSVITVNNGSELPAAPTVVSLYCIILFIHPLFTAFIIIIITIISVYIYLFIYFFCCRCRRLHPWMCIEGMRVHSQAIVMVIV
jgi:hypothetical protein